LKRDDVGGGAECRELKVNFDVDSGDGKFGLQPKPEHSLSGRRALTVSARFQIVIELASVDKAGTTAFAVLIIGYCIGDSELDRPYPLLSTSIWL
jgi:hypothetical protein